MRKKKTKSKRNKKQKIIMICVQSHVLDIHPKLLYMMNTQTKTKAQDLIMSISQKEDDSVDK